MKVLAETRFPAMKRDSNKKSIVGRSGGSKILLFILWVAERIFD